MNETVVVDAVEVATKVEATEASTALRALDVTELDMIGGGSGIYLF